MSERAVLILGAGFSCDFNLPLLTGITKFVRTHNDVSSEDKAFIDDLQRQTRATAASLEASDNNLESMLSVALMQRRMDLNDNESIVSRIQRILRTICTPGGADFRDNYMTYLDSVDSLIGNGLGKTGELTVITTNYDTIIETCLAIRHDRPYLPGVSLEEHENLYAKAPRYTTLCKLHGSCNWKHADGKITTSDHLKTAHFMGYDDDYSLTIPDSWSLTGKDKEYTPFIIPPTLYKSQAESCIAPTWNAASESLATADRIVCIGFSFPDSDTYLKYFFATALNENINCDSIEILDPCANTISKRLSSNYGFGPAITNRLKPIQSPWMKAKIPPLFP